MLMINRTPLNGGLSQMHSDMNQWLCNILGDAPRAAQRSLSTPPMNVWENGETYFIEAELPGFAMNDLEVTVLDNEVTIRGERAHNDAEGAVYLRRERTAGSFSRTWSLPDDVDAEKVEASLKDGVLLLTLPKVEQVKPRKIQIRTAGADSKGETSSASE